MLSAYESIRYEYQFYKQGVVSEALLTNLISFSTLLEKTSALFFRFSRKLEENRMPEIVLFRRIEDAVAGSAE
jgi:hypothetical protein